jgi:hypothetical protein
MIATTFGTDLTLRIQRRPTVLALEAGVRVTGVCEPFQPFEHRNPPVAGLTAPTHIIIRN